jgi:NADPH-dependent curcumin reductase CurA
MPKEFRDREFCRPPPEPDSRLIGPQLTAVTKCCLRTNGRFAPTAVVRMIFAPSAALGSVVVSTAAGAAGSDRSPRSLDAGRLGSPAGPRKSHGAVRCSATTWRSITRAAIESALAAACPKGVDLYFDNTGGAISDTVSRQLAVGGRVVICGTASGVNLESLAQRTASRAPSVSEACTHARIRYFRLRASV